MNSTESRLAKKSAQKICRQVTVLVLVVLIVDHKKLRCTCTMAEILLLGDSLTQLGFEGWAATLANVYQGRADVINRGRSGYNTKNVLDYIVLPSCYHLSLVTIFLGANDASLPSENPRQYISLEDYSRNLKTLIQRVNEKYNSPRILLINPPPLDHAQRLEYQKIRYGDLATGRLERTTENTALYSKACLQVGTELNVPCLNLFSIMAETPNYNEFFYDGLHFSPKGHVFVAQQVLKAIQQHYPEIHVTPCPNTGQYNNSASHCSVLPSFAPYHDNLTERDNNDFFSSMLGRSAGS
jgi:isoamyl acetate esterase